MADPRPLHCREVPAGVAWAVDTLCEMARDGASGEVTIELDAGRAVGVQRQLRFQFHGPPLGAVRKAGDILARGLAERVAVEVDRKDSQRWVVVVEDRQHG